MSALNVSIGLADPFRSWPVFIAPLGNMSITKEIWRVARLNRKRFRSLFSTGSGLTHTDLCVSIALL